MSPFIKNGDVITLSPLFDTSLRVGDVAAFIQPGTGKLVVHRIVGKRNDSFLMKGDNISDVDGFIPEAKILGCVTTVERDGKSVFLGLGPERILIALLTRWGQLPDLFIWIRRLARVIIRG